MKRDWSRWHRKLSHLDSEIVKLYLSGLSTRQVASKFNISSSWVYKIVKKQINLRSQSDAAILRQPAMSRHWRACRCAARKVWERNVGPIPIGWHVHHVDGDHTNNSLDNLRLMDPSSHAKLHHPPNPIPRWLRPERKEYMKKYQQERAKRVKETRLL